MVLCPLSVTDGWISEFTKFCPRLNVLRYVGEKGQRLGLRRMMYEHIQKQSSSGDVSAKFLIGSSCLMLLFSGDSMDMKNSDVPVIYFILVFMLAKPCWICFFRNYPFSLLIRVRTYFSNFRRYIRNYLSMCC